MTSHKRPLYREIASLVGARMRCIATNNCEWPDRHGDTLRLFAKDFLPRGSGVDSGTLIDLDASTQCRLVFTTSYHHMNDGGYYDGWTDHTVVVKADLAGDIDIRITGRNRNDIRDYLHELFHHYLTQKVWWVRDEESDTVQWHSDLYGEPAVKFCGGDGI